MATNFTLSLRAEIIFTYCIDNLQPKQYGYCQEKSHQRCSRGSLILLPSKACSNSTASVMQLLSVKMRAGCRFWLSACQGCWSCTVLIMQQPEQRQDDCRPDRKWREIMIGQPALCLRLLHAHINGTSRPVGFLLWQLSIFRFIYLKMDINQPLNKGTCIMISQKGSF